MNGFLTILFITLTPFVDHPGDNIRLGDAAYADFRTRDAIEYYTIAYTEDRTDFYTLSRLARAWSDLGRLSLRRSDSSEYHYRTALSYAQELAVAHPDSAASWFLLALCHGSLVPFKSLAEKLEIAQDVEKNALHSLEIDSTYSMTYVLLGIYYRGVSRLGWFERTIVNGILGKDIYGTIEDAEGNLKKALEYDPDNSFAYYELFWTYRVMGRPDDAANALRRVMSFKPRNERELQQQRDAQRRLDRWEAASE